MHPAIIIGTVRSLIVDVAMRQIPRSIERISSYSSLQFTVLWQRHSYSFHCLEAAMS